ncbi:alpha-1,2-fucosyltransferase [Neolewinella persica]|uniref:alpha-1,2-fucosyltransferase n=1 Tax=Neolewinella persica TaxID=70998 RepID=UPI000475ADC9|nr:alpha-1,2-fucosyltransferase [Neolewinella persica]
MFQYAFARRIQLQLNVKLRIDLSILLDSRPPDGYIKREYDLDIFKLSPAYHCNPTSLRILYAPGKYRWSQVVRDLARKGYPVYMEKSFSVDNTLLDSPPDNVIYQGYWQSERYFSEVANTIRKDFAFQHSIQPQSESLAREIRKEDSVCLNIRRKDYLASPTHNVTDETYYENCIQQMRERFSGARFFLFSDDLVWCREFFADFHDVVIVGHDHAGPKFGNYLQLMAQCHHYIIPNSTFAWWAAWLGERTGSVIMAPERWFGTDEFDYRDVVPERWLKVPN